MISYVVPLRLESHVVKCYDKSWKSPLIPSPMSKLYGHRRRTDYFCTLDRVDVSTEIGENTCFPRILSFSTFPWMGGGAYFPVLLVWILLTRLFSCVSEALSKQQPWRKGLNSYSKAVSRISRTFYPMILFDISGRSYCPMSSLGKDTLNSK